MMSSSKSRRSSFAVLVICLLMLSLTGIIQAQETRGTISGTITDPNGQAVPNASVHVTDPSRGTTQTFTTNSDGFYRATFLPPGTYRVVVEAQGFKKSVRNDVLVEIAAAVQLSIPLEVGGTEETVNVTADVPAINTENASLGLVIDSRRLEDLPLIHGDPYKLTYLSPY